MSQPNPNLTPDPILQNAFGFWSSKVLLTAVEFGLFTRLASRKLTGAELATSSNCTRARSEISSTRSWR